MIRASSMMSRSRGSVAMLFLRIYPLLRRLISEIGFVNFEMRSFLTFCFLDPLQELAEVGSDIVEGPSQILDRALQTLHRPREVPKVCVVGHLASPSLPESLPQAPAVLRLVFLVAVTPPHRTSTAAIVVHCSTSTAEIRSARILPSRNFCWSSLPKLSMPMTNAMCPFGSMFTDPTPMGMSPALSTGMMTNRSVIIRSLLTYEFVNVSELVDGLASFLEKILEVLHVDSAERQITRRLRFEPEVSLGTGDRILLVVLDSIEQSSAETFLHRDEASGTTDELHLRGRIRSDHGFDRVEVQVHGALGDLLRFTEVVEADLVVALAKQLLEDVRVLELRTDRGPGTDELLLAGPAVLRHVHRVVHESELAVRSLVLEVVAVLLAEFFHELDVLVGGVGDLHRVRLDVNDLGTTLMERALQIDHEEGSSLGDDIVHISNITEGVDEFGRGEAVNDVDDDLKSVGKRIRILIRTQKLPEL